MFQIAETDPFILYIHASLINNKSRKFLSDIALMKIEREETAKAYFDEIIDGFPSIKAQKVFVLINIFV